MKKSVLLYALPTGFALLMLLGLPLFIHYMLDRHASARIVSAGIVPSTGRALIALSMEESHADSSDRGVVHSRSGDYAQLVDMAEGRLLWSRRLKAADAHGHDAGDGVLLAQTPRQLFFLRNALYIFDIAHGQRTLGEGPLKALTADAALERLAWQPQRHALAVLDRQGRSAWIDTDSLAVRPDAAMDPAMLSGPGAVDAGGYARPATTGGRVMLASGAIDADGSCWLLTSAAGEAALLLGRQLGEGGGLDLRRRLLHGRLDGQQVPAGHFQVLSSQPFLGGSLLLDPEAGENSQTRVPAPVSDAMRQPGQAFADAIGELQRRGGPLVDAAAAWTVGPQRDWLVLHRRSSNVDDELLLSALGRDGQVRWTLALGISRLDRLWRQGRDQWMASGPAIGRQSDRLLRVDLAQGQGIGYGVLDRDTAPLSPVMANAEDAQ